MSQFEIDHPFSSFQTASLNDNIHAPQKIESEKMPLTLGGGDDTTKLSFMKKNNVSMIPLIAYTFIL